MFCRTKANKLLRPFLSPALVQKVNEEFKLKTAAEEAASKAAAAAAVAPAEDTTTKSPSPTLSPDTDWFNAFHQIPNSGCLLKTISSN